MKTIGQYAFSGMTSVSGYTVPNKYLKNVIIPDSVETIGGYAFSYCTNLRNVIIGKNVTSIGEYAFGSCTSLTRVFYLGTSVSCSSGFSNSYTVLQPVCVTSNYTGSTFCGTSTSRDST